MDGKFYVVYRQSEYYIDDYIDQTDTEYSVVQKYFTNEDSAEEYAEYLNMADGDRYFVEEVECGDDIDVSLLIFELKEAQRVKELAREKESRAREVENMALYQSRITGEDYIDLLHKLREQYMDYVLNGN